MVFSSWKIHLIRFVLLGICLLSVTLKHCFEALTLLPTTVVVLVEQLVLCVYMFLSGQLLFEQNDLYIWCDNAFSTLILLVWYHKEHLVGKNWVIECWCGCLTGVGCRLFACGPADATAIPEPHHLLPDLNSDWFFSFLLLAYPGCPG